MQPVGGPHLHYDFSNDDDRLLARSLNRDHTPDPDAFYGPFISDELGQVDHAGLVVGHLPSTMAATSKRRPPPPTGPSTKSPAGVGRGAAASSARSASSPAPGAAKTTGVGATSTPRAAGQRTSQNSVKEIASRLNQNAGGSPGSPAQRNGRVRTGSSPKPPHSGRPTSRVADRYLNGNTTANSPHTPRTTPTPSSQHSATRSPRTLKKDSPSQTHAEAQRGSNSHEMSEVAGNRPLFGEVITGFMGDSKPGFGIEELECPSPYAGSMHQPNAMFPHNRSRSDGDPLPHYATPKRNSANERNTLIKKHRHSHSDLARIDAKTPLDVKGDSHLSPSSSQRTPTSRIPTKAGRPTSTEPVRPLPSSRSTSALDARRRTPTPSSERPSGKENRPGSRPITPQYLTSRRFDPHNPSAAKNNPSLKANIITSVPKASPPLRRTRDRQTVTREPPTRESVMTKGTAASRARAAERNASPAADRSRQRRHLQKRSPSRKRAQVQLESVDVAARREAIKAKLSQSSIKSKEAAAEEQGESQVAKMKSTEPVLEEVPEDESKESRTNPPALVLNVDNLPTQGDSEASTATTDFETDESPVVGSRGRASQLAPPEGYAFQIRRSARDSDALQKDLANHYGTPDVSDGSVRDGSLSTVDRNSIASSIDFAPGWQLPKAYEESINIMLGATPVPPSIPSFGEPGQRQNHTPAPNQYLVADPSNAPGHAPAGHMPVGDNQLSTAAVDGASPNFTPNKASSSENVMSRDVPRDTAAYSTIHRIFEHYHNSAYVSPETAHGFQQEMAKVSPYLAQHGNWTSRDATLRYLEGLMKASPVSDDNDSFPEYQSRQAGYGADLDPFRALDSTPNEEYTGVAMVYSPKVWGRDSGGDIWYTPPVEQQDSDKGAQDKHQTYKPTPPPKDVDAAEPDAVREDMSSTPKVSNFSRPRPSELEADGLGLTVPDSKLGAQHSQLGKVQALFDPPAPTYTPPPPPNEALRSPPSPSVYSRPPYSAAPPTSSTFGEEIHPLSREPTQSTLVGEDQLGGSTLNEGQPGSPSRPPSDKDDPSKALKERYFQLKELVDTESSFHQDMVVLEDIYKSTSTAVDITDEDRRILFGNSDRIVQFSKTFLDDIRRAVSPVYKPPRPNKWSTRRGSFSTVATEQTSTANSDTDSDRLTQDLKTTVGMVFRQHLANMEKVYTDYAKNHDAANTRLAKLLQQPDVKLWVDQCASQSRDLTTAWDLDSLIIKPTQRVLKYSLLLKDIFKNTVEDHPDRENIYIAKQELEAACTRINEATGRASLVRKVMNRDRKVSGAKLRIPKLLDTRTEKLRQQIGLSNAVDDPEYDAISQKFGGHFFQLQIVMRDVERYIDEVDQFGRRCDAFILSLEDFLQVEHTAFPEIESKWRKFSQIIRQINTVALKEHKQAIRQQVIDPIQTLWKLHEGPQQVMAKRKKRAVEWAIVKQAKKNGDKPNKKLQEYAEASKEFDGLNKALKEELPRLYRLTKELIEACLHIFIELQMRWQSTLDRKLSAVVEGPRKAGTSSLEDTWRALLMDYQCDVQESNDKLSYLGIVNGATLNEVANLLSPTASFPIDDSSFYRDDKRPSVSKGSKRTQSMNSDPSTVNSLDLGIRYGTTMTYSPMIDTMAANNDGRNPLASGGRMRSGSAMSSRGPSTPRSMAGQTPATSYFPTRPSTSRSAEPSPGFPRLSVEFPEPQLSPGPNGNFIPQGATQSATNTPPLRYSGIFSSAMPMSDSPPTTRPPSPKSSSNPPPKVLFLAASLFEFNIDGSRREAGYPYLRYVPGEVFDVLATKGELWLARNQDDESSLIGWIWEKHFARILPDES